MENVAELKERLARYEIKQLLLERQLAEQADFLENGPMPLQWVNAAGIIIWANKAELDMLGYSAEQYIGFPISQFHEDLPVITDMLRRLTENETLQNYTARLRCRDGTVKHVLINSNVLWKNGEFVYARCFTRDITHRTIEEQKKAALLFELEQSEARLRMAIESTKLGTWDYHVTTGFLSWSPECRKIYGIPADTPVNFDLFEKLIHEADRERVLEEISTAMQPGFEPQYDITLRIHRYNDNSIRWIRSQGKVYFDETGTATRFFGTVLDITDVKIAEERSAQLAAIVDSSYDAIISKTLDGIISSWNSAAERIFGYNASEIIGKSILTIIPPNRVDEESQILSRLRNGERVEHFETKRMTKSGQSLDISLTISPVRDSNGRITGLSKIARDISVKKQEESRKNDFLAMLSHELKTPLTAILGYTQLLIARAPKDASDFSTAALLKTEVQAKKMIAMTRNFLDLARLEEGKITLISKPFELGQLIAEVVNEARFLDSVRVIEIETNGKAVVNGDRDKIGQVLNNLLSNAMKYSPHETSILISYKIISGSAVVSVCDKGIGISVVHQRRLFDRFYRVENEYVQQVPGFGIGLYLASEILRSHGSSIQVQSKEDEGATFSFDLPLA